MNYNKATIKKNIDHLKIAVDMDIDIRDGVEAMKHYKNVNKKFTDLLAAKGYYSNIRKDRYGIELVVCRMELIVYGNNPKIDVNNGIVFRAYVRHLVSKHPLTWQVIIDKLNHYNFRSRLEEAFLQKENFEQERHEFTKLCAYIEKLEFKSFDLYHIKRDLQQILEFANKD